MAENTLGNAIIDALNDFGEQLIQDTAASLRRKKHTDASGQSGLIGSARFTLRRTGSQLEFIFTMADYWEAVDKGRGKGKRQPPIKPLLDWLARRNVNGLAIYRSKLKNPAKSRVKFKDAQRSLAFAIAKDVARKGTIRRFGYRGSRFFSELIEDGRLERLSEDLSEIIGEKIEIELTKELKGTI